MKPIMLYKNHDNYDCNILQAIVRYLYAAHNIDIRSTAIIERNIPSHITILPTIVLSNNNHIRGIYNIANYYEHLFGLNNLISNATLFNQLNPHFRITDNSTHRNVIL